jgi:hypothetical protein
MVIYLKPHFLRVWICLILLLIQLVCISANTLTYLYENTYSPTRNQSCLNYLNSIVTNLVTIENAFYYFGNGKTLNDFGDYDACEQAAYNG